MTGNSGSVPGDVFDVRKVRKFIELMNEHDLSEIDLRQGDQRIRLRRGPEMVTMAAAPAIQSGGGASFASAAGSAERAGAGASGSSGYPMAAIHPGARSPSRRTW